MSQSYSKPNVGHFWHAVYYTYLPVIFVVQRFNICCGEVKTVELVVKKLASVNEPDVLLSADVL